MLYDEALRKDYNELLESAIEKLREKTGLTDFSAGSVARSILEVVYDDIYLLYNDLATVATKYFLPNATGQYLDELSKLFGMERLPGESDTNFRYRISRWTQDKAKANETAIRFACLSVEGVHDIIIKKYVRGTGTFDVYVITDDPQTPQHILDEVQRKIDETQAIGIDGKAVAPKPKEIDLRIQYTYYANVNEEDKINIRHEAETRLREYLNNLPLGSDIIINRIINLLMDVDRNKIKNVEITRMFINKREVIVGNKTSYWDERIVPANITIN